MEAYVLEVPTLLYLPRETQLVLHLTSKAPIGANKAFPSNRRDNRPLTSTSQRSKLANAYPQRAGALHFYSLQNFLIKVLTVNSSIKLYYYFILSFIIKLLINNNWTRGKLFCHFDWALTTVSRAWL